MARQVRSIDSQAYRTLIRIPVIHNIQAMLTQFALPQRQMDTNHPMACNLSMWRSEGTIERDGDMFAFHGSPQDATRGRVCDDKFEETS